MHEGQSWEGRGWQACQETQFAQGCWAHPPLEVLPLTQERVVRERGGISGGWTQVAVVFLASQGRQLTEAKLTSPEAGTPCLDLHTVGPEGS